MKLTDILNNKQLRVKASSMVEITDTAILGPTGWKVNDREITSQLVPIDKVNYIRVWFVNGIKVPYKYCLLLTYKLLKLI